MSAIDALVVGAGPAGSTTALWLARAGYNVELLERRAFPRAKPCGDCISPGANALFRRLGVHDQIARRAAQLTGWTLAADRGGAFSSRFAGCSQAPDSHYAFAMPRRELDAILLEAARAAGVLIRTGAHVTQLLRAPDGAVLGVVGTQAGEPFSTRARLTVGADGLRSRIGRALGAYGRPRSRLQKVSFTAHVHVPDASAFGEMHITGGTCLGVAPVGVGPRPVCNVTTVVHAGCAPPHTGAHDMMRSLLRRFPQRDLSALIGDDTEVLACGPFDMPARQIVFEGAALVGDAAGYYDPFTGQGIYQALAGAELLAGCASSSLAHATVTKQSLGGYAAGQHQLVGGARRVQHAIEFVCARPRIASALFDALRRAPEAADRLIAVTGDLLPVRDLLSPGLLARLIAAVVPSTA